MINTQYIHFSAQKSDRSKSMPIRPDTPTPFIKAKKSKKITFASDLDSSEVESSLENISKLTSTSRNRSPSPEPDFSEGINFSDDEVDSSMPKKVSKKPDYDDHSKAHEGMQCKSYFLLDFIANVNTFFSYNGV